MNLPRTCLACGAALVVACAGPPPAVANRPSVSSDTSKSPGLQPAAAHQRADRGELGDAAPAAPVDTPVASEPSSEPRGQVVLTSYFEALLRDGSKRPLASGDQLRSGDRIAIVLGLREPLYLYILYVDPRGEASVLFPERGDVLQPAGEPLRFPDGQELELDDVLGWERLIVIASRRPLSQSDGVLAALVDRVRSAHRWPEAGVEAPQPGRNEKEPARPTTASAPRQYTGPVPVLEGGLASADRRGPTRGVHLVKAGSPRIESIADADGVVAIPLLIEHVR